MASGSSGPVDAFKPGRFKVVLGDSILNRSSPKEILTGIRYNHKPTLSTPSAPTHANLAASQQQQAPGAPQSFDVNFADHGLRGGKYLYTGQRTTDPNQFVLIFDPDEQSFRLERVDSMFHMNLSSTPSNTDPESLRQEFPHLDTSKSATPIKVDGPPPPKKGGRRNGERKPPPSRKPSTRKSTATAKDEPSIPEAETVDMALSAPPPPKAAILSPAEAKKKNTRDAEPDSDEDDDSDGDLIVEYPGGKPPPVPAAFSSNVNNTYVPTPFEKFLQGHDDQEDADEGGHSAFESDEDDDKQSVVSDQLKLPSPVNHPPPLQEHCYPEEEESEQDDQEGGDLEAALEAAFDAAFEEAHQEDSEEMSEED